MRRSSVAITLVVILVLVTFAGYQLYDLPTPHPTPHTGPQTVQLAGRSIGVSVADTESSRRQGLGGRLSLGADEGMLFIFPEEGRYAFWMKDMHFSIDILWLKSDGTIVYMAQNVSPETYPKAFDPHTNARFVLELPAGYTKAYTVRVGDVVRF